jgi:hypothetical protein
MQQQKNSIKKFIFTGKNWVLPALKPMSAGCIRMAGIF